ncbi:MAG: hypothetical protein L0Y71_17275 [Gemmataceae bacterium]|nr:hypothetical protein [Gemmataceae bacterium]
MSPMRPLLASLWSFVVLASCLVVSQAQEFAKKKKGKGHSEDEKMLKLLEKSFKHKGDKKGDKGVDPVREAAKVFRHIDADGDGLLANDEIPMALRDSLGRWDIDRDGRISAPEYLEYFGRRFEYLRQDIAAGIMAPPRSRVVESLNDERPRVFRAGKLPRELPSWFVELDQDRDGQVAMWEWRRQKGASGKALIEEFRGIDRNEDGFMTPEEALRHVHLQQSKRAQP